MRAGMAGYEMPTVLLAVFSGDEISGHAREASQGGRVTRGLGNDGARGTMWPGERCGPGNDVARGTLA
jgi:hypothetical protein